MVEHDGHVGQLLKLIDDLGLANDTVVMYSTDNGPHYKHLARCRYHHLPQREELELGRRVSLPAFVRWPGNFPAGVTLNGIVSHEDWLPTFATIAGSPDIKEKLLKGTTINGRTYKNYIDGYNQLDYLTGKVKNRAQGILVRERRRPDRCCAVRRLESSVP